MPRLFVYGTLKRGCKNHRHLAGQRYLGEARTAPGYRLHDLGGYPGMVPDPADTAGVTGELWQVDASALAKLDAFEGVPERLYDRVAITTIHDGEIAQADAYLYARDIAGCPRLGPTWGE